MAFLSSLRLTFAGIAAWVAMLFSSLILADVAQSPLYTTRAVMPLNMLVMGRDHKLYFEAYNDASDLDGDGAVEIRFKPSITYFGYFDSAKCYAYNNSRFEPTDLADSGTWTDPVSNTSKVTAGICSAKTGRWSGNYLNYLTTSRIDALRKVLYGGKRSTDAATTSSANGETVLERSAIPQDGHSWGKEYTSTAVDGYNIADYTPLAQPAAGFRHLFASVTLGDATTAAVTNPPLLRVLLNSNYRIWEWVSIEQPVAGDKCLNGGSGPTCVHAASTDATHPSSDSDFVSLLGRVVGQPLTPTAGISITRINKTVNGATSLPDSNVQSGQQDYYVTDITATLNIPTTGAYTFAVTGDDAVEVLIDGVSVVGWYGGHGTGNFTDHSGLAITLAAGAHSLEFRHEEVDGGDVYSLGWKKPGDTAFAIVPASGTAGLSGVVLKAFSRNIPASTLTDYSVRTQVCKPGLLEDNCEAYIQTSGGASLTTYKPTGLLQDYGYAASGDPKMKFGLLSGSYTNNLKGGVLRRAVSNISDEISSATGQFSSVVGIIQTIDRLRTVGFYSFNYSANCGRISTRTLNNGECRMWGNPIAEMMYEGIRYFSGKTAPTASYNYTGTSGDDQALGLPNVGATWTDPYVQPGSQSCSAPVETVISDINPSYDTDDLPGANWNTSGFTGDISGLDVGALGTAIWNVEYGGPKLAFIGEAGGVTSGGPTAKTITTFATARGLAPEEPTKMGGFYAASIAYYGRTHVLNALSDQKLTTYSVALASPLPQIKIPIGGGFVTLIPFGKSTAGNSISAAQSAYQPTNGIVDFYIEQMAADGTSGIFRVNYEDTEQGADYDMDAIVRYTYKVNSDNTLTVTLSSDYAGGGIIQHLGYIISGTTKDGVYLDVRDQDTAAGDANDVNYYLDTPPGFDPGQVTASTPHYQLPLASTRTFYPSTTVAATLLKSPLWYAAKYGGFTDRNNSATPDIKEEWTSASGTDPDPDNYFLVTNALGLRAQLDKAFGNILKQLSSASSAATSSGQFVAGTTRIIQGRFRSDDWSGEVLGYSIGADFAPSAVVWNAASLLPVPANRNIYTLNGSSSTTHGVSFLWSNLTTAQQAFFKKTISGTSTVSDTIASQRVNYLRGDTSLEQGNGGTFRDRPHGVFGDVVDSGPVYVDNNSSQLPIVPSADAASYQTYRTGLSSRPEMVYAGANDGMLHAICATACGSTAEGTEIFSYIPASIMPELYQLTLPTYVHRYYVDGPTTVSDAKLSSGWGTALVGATGAGGQNASTGAAGGGIYALDVTSPTSFNATKVLWEFTADTERAALSGGSTTITPDLGYTIGKPRIGRVKAGDASVAIFSNGFDGQSGKASLFVVNLQTGALIKRLQVPISSGVNGLAAPTLLDSDNDGYIDFVYAGDLQGNMWRFDLRDSSANNWVAGINGLPLFTARSAAGAVQPITVQPAVSQVYSRGEVLVYVGTGRYLSTGDKTDTTGQAFYAVRDKWLNDSTTHTAALTKANLQQQTTVITTVNSVATTAVTQNSVNYANQDGWYMTLPVPASGGSTRIVAAATLSGSIVTIVGLTPSVDACGYGGTSPNWTLDALGGSRTNTATVTVAGVVYSISGTVANRIETSPADINTGNETWRYTSGSDGNITTGSIPNTNHRLSWREIVE